MADQLQLSDGTPAWIWPLLPTDRGALAEEFLKLSPASRRQRFLAPVDRLTDSMLDQLVDSVDGVDHVALILLVECGDEVIPVGVGRILRYPELADAADLAVTVSDSWHGRGVATALLAELVGPHRPPGVTHILTEVAADNAASLAMLRRLGPTRVHDAAPGILDVEVDLDGSRGPHPETRSPRSANRLHPVLDDPRRLAALIRHRLRSLLAAGISS